MRRLDSRDHTRIHLARLLLFVCVCTDSGAANQEGLLAALGVILGVTTVRSEAKVRALSMEKMFSLVF